MSERYGKYSWRKKAWDTYDAGQAWIVVTLVGMLSCGQANMKTRGLIFFLGMAIGLNAAFLNIVTEWLSDIKLGYCTTAFYLNESFCCWGAESGKKETFPGNMLR
jgi:chloride channel 3/4/5